MAYLHPCKTCGRLVSTDAAVCPGCGQPEPVSEPPLPPFLPELGKVYVGRITSTTTFGAFVEITRGVEGLLHISELGPKRVEKTEDVVKKGDVVQVKLLAVDNHGRMRLSLQSLSDVRVLAVDTDVRCNCGEAGVEDPRSTNWPPRIVEGRLRVPFVCSAGHLFVRDLDRT